MKFISAASFVGVTHSAMLRNDLPPTAKVTKLLMDMKARIEGDGKLEQMSYDKYACWCEETTARKARDITKAKQDLKDLQEHIMELSGDLGSLGANVKQLEKDIGANEESQNEATEVRKKEKGAYEAEKSESENCLGALEAAIAALDGAGEGEKKSFLETSHQVEMLSIVTGLRNVLFKAEADRITATEDLDMVKRFIAHSRDVFENQHNSVSAVQTENNPFGDYAPQSTQIQGILKGMHDGFTASLKKANEEEAESVKLFDELMDTKGKELDTLKRSYERQKTDYTEKNLDNADSKEKRADTEEQLEADEVFFDETKKGCKAKAREWSSRSRLRTEELMGVGKAIEILTDPENVDLFNNLNANKPAPALMQIASHRSTQKASMMEAQRHLAKLARTYHTKSLSLLVMHAKVDGHFDKLLAAIDKMIAELRAEAQDDIEHRDRCGNAENANANAREDLENELAKANTLLERLTKKEIDLKGEATQLKEEIKDLKDEMAEALQLRNEAVAEYRKSLKDNTMAVEVLQSVVTALVNFYKANKIPIALLGEDPKYTIDKDKAPETNWEGGDYGGRKSENNIVVNLINMLIEDTQKDIKVSTEDNEKAEQQYEKERSAQEDTMAALKDRSLLTEKEKADTKQRIADLKGRKADKTQDLADEKDVLTGLANDCSWVATHFAARRVHREKEIKGLQDAKGYLAGME